jgi:hypothetical protein
VCYTCPPRGWKERLSAESELLVYTHKINNMWKSKNMSLPSIWNAFPFVFQIFSFDYHVQVVFSAASMQKKCLSVMLNLESIDFEENCSKMSFCTRYRYRSIWIKFWADRKWQKLRAGTWQTYFTCSICVGKIEGKRSQIINGGTFAHRSTYYLLYAYTPHWIARRAVSNSYCWWCFATKENAPPPPPHKR